MIGDGIEVAWMVAVDHGLELSAEQFFKPQNQIPTRVSSAEGRSVRLLWRKSAGPHQDFHLNAVRPSSDPGSLGDFLTNWYYG